MQTAIVFVIIAAAAIYVARVFYKGFKQKKDCSCGCSCCTTANICNSSSPGANSSHISTERHTPSHR